MIRKIFGIFFLIFGAFVVLSILVYAQETLNTFQLLPKITSDELTSWDKWGAIWKTFFFLFQLLLIYWSFKYGTRLMQSRRKKFQEEEQAEA